MTLSSLSNSAFAASRELGVGIGNRELGLAPSEQTRAIGVERS